MRRLSALAFCAGCSFTPGQLGGSDAGSHGGSDAAAACSFSTQVNTCSLSGTTDLVLSGSNTYDTGTGTLRMGATLVPVTHLVLAAGEGNVDALIIRDFHMSSGATLRATGKLPLAIVAFGGVMLDDSASIDLSDGGAGARASCANAAMPGKIDGGGGGGGGGGGFGAHGGMGGAGNYDTGPSAGGVGGAAADPPRGPLGGCPGAVGGDGADPGGEGGAAGGAIYIVAHDQIVFAVGTSINAGGGGGHGGHHSSGTFGDAGGGGGGSGGTIVIEAQQFGNAGILAANGGSGGEGSGDGIAGGPGNAGLASTSSAPGSADHSPTATEGGAGGALNSPAGADVGGVLDGGGGGGGGGVGFVWILAPGSAGTTSPARR